MTITKLGKYELHEQLGKGGFGTVYRATDTVLGREVALKVLHPQLTVDADFIERFRNEARRIAAFDHPNIATVYDMGEENGRVFIAMRYLPGGSLRDKLRREGAIPFEQALQIVKEVSAGLKVAHANGLIHRDIKPENILFTEDEQAVISDFGLAKAIQASSLSTSSSLGGVGTPAYRAPELWRGKPPASPATDEYSLACVFTEMLTGRQLFDGDTPDEIIAKHLVDGVRLPKKWPSEVPSGINAILLKALDKAPQRRYANSVDFAAALERPLNDQPESLRSRGVTPRAVNGASKLPRRAATILPPAPRPAALMGAGALVCLLLAAGGGVLLWLWPSLVPASAAATQFISTVTVATSSRASTQRALTQTFQANPLATSTSKATPSPVASASSTNTPMPTEYAVVGTSSLPENWSANSFDISYGQTASNVPSSAKNWYVFQGSKRDIVDVVVSLHCFALTGPGTAGKLRPGELDQDCRKKGVSVDLTLQDALGSALGTGRSSGGKAVLTSYELPYTGKFLIFLSYSNPGGGSVEAVVQLSKK